MSRFSKFAYSWFFALGTFLVVLDASLVLVFSMASFVMLENLFPDLDTLFKLGRITLVIAAFMATVYIFSPDGRRDWR